MKRLLLCNIFNIFILQISIAQQLHVNHTRFIGGSKGAQGLYSISTKDGGILFVGRTNSTSNGGGDIPSGIVDSSANVIVGKVDNNENLLWVKVFGGSLFDHAVSACETNDGGYAVLCLTESQDGDIVGAKGSNDMWLIKVDSSGNKQWAKIYGSSQDDEPMSVSNTPDNGLIILGASVGSDGDVPFHYGGMFSFDWVVIKTDIAGNKQWAKVIGSTNDESTIGGIVSANGGYYLASAAATSDHDCIDSSWHPGVNTNGDFYLFFLDTAGNTKWVHSYGGSNDEHIKTAIWDDRDSSIVMVGTTYSHDYMAISNLGGENMFVVKTYKDGNLKWAIALGDFNSEEGISISKGPYGGYFAAANSECGNNPPAPHIGGTDVWLFNIDSSGNYVTDKIIGTLGYELTGSVLQHNNGCIISGSTDSELFTEGTHTLFRGGADIFLSYIDYWPVSVFNINRLKSIQAYPNPSNDLLHIDNVTSSISYQLQNIVGMTLLRGIFTQEQNTIQIQSLPAGVYLLQLTNQEGQRTVVRVVKE